MKPPNKAMGDPKPKKGNTHKIVKIRKPNDNKKIFVYLSSEKYSIFSLIKS